MRGLDFLDSTELPRRGSWIWNCIVDSRRFLLKGACKWIAKDSKVRIIGDPWIPGIKDF